MNKKQNLHVMSLGTFKSSSGTGSSLNACLRLWKERYSKPFGAPLDRRSQYVSYCNNILLLFY